MGYMALYIPSSKLLSPLILLSLVINCALILSVGSLVMFYKLVVPVMPLPC